MTFRVCFFLDVRFFIRIVRHAFAGKQPVLSAARLKMVLDGTTTKG